MTVVKKQRGLTLMELLVTLSIAGVLMSVAVPSFTWMVRNNRMAAQVNEFMNSLSRARNEAMKAGVSVTVCRSADQVTCGGGAGWEAGWLMYPEYGGVIGTRNTAGVGYSGGTLLADSIITSTNTLIPRGTAPAANVTSRPEEALQALPALTGGATLRGSNNVLNRITFNNQGMVPGLVGATFTFCDSRGASAAREIRVLSTGQVRLCRPVTTGTQPCSNPAFAPTCP